MTSDGNWSKDGTQCPDHDDYWSKLVEAQNPDVVILLVGAWDLYARDWGNGPVAPGDREFDQNYSVAIDATLKVLSAKGAEVIVLTTPCFEPGPGERAGPQHDIQRVQRIAELQREAVAKFNDLGPQTQASIVELQSVTCDNGFTQNRDGVAWRPDGVHFSVDGSKVAARWILEALPETARSRLGFPT
jgi:lysophospholipase L1-like esterase